MASPLKILERSALKAKNRFAPQKQAEVDRLLYLLQNVPPARPDIDAWHRETAALIGSLVISRISSEDMASILAGLASYRLTGITPERTQPSLVSAFCNSSGLFQDLIHDIFFQRREAGSAAQAPASEFFGALNESAIGRILRELDEEGYCVLPFRLPQALIEAIRTESRTLDYTLREKAHSGVPDKVRGIDPANPPESVAAYADNGQILASPLLSRLANDPLMVHLASAHIKAEARPIDATLWYSFPSRNPSGESAQLFHFDLDTLRWLKVFYYLSDVTPESGPHTYVRGTHKPGVKSSRLLQMGYSRITDEEMEAAHPGRTTTITGPAGTVILGDTRCFHKGTHLEAGHRLIYSPIYAPSRIGYYHGPRK